MNIYIPADMWSSVSLQGFFNEIFITIIQKYHFAVIFSLTETQIKKS